MVLKMLANVQQKTIKPLFEKFVKAGSMVNSDEYVIYDRLEAWGYGHVSVNHSAGEFARDADGDGEIVLAIHPPYVRPGTGFATE